MAPLMGSPLDRARRIVIKTGSALIAAKGAPRRDWIGGLAADIAALRAAGKEVVWVSSGAVALGRPHLGKGSQKKLEEKQAAAALGQPLLMSAIAHPRRYRAPPPLAECPCHARHASGGRCRARHQ